MTDNDGRRWYAVRTKPMKELYARDNLARQGFSVYLPLIRRLVSHARKKAIVPRPFFSGYLFVHLAPLEQNWVSINSTYGVACALRFGNVYPPVADEIIQTLKNREDEAGYIDLGPGGLVPFKKGDRIAVKTGEGVLEGLFQEMSGEDRALVLVEILKRQVAVKVPVEAVSAAKL